MSTPAQEKRGIIKSFSFTKIYDPPAGGKRLYCHECLMENGDSGTVYCIEQDPPQHKPGVEVIYNHIPQGQRSSIKILRKYMDEQTQAAQTANSNKAKSYNRSTDFIGMSFAYAKDIIVAKIMSESSKSTPVIPVKASKKPAAANPKESESGTTEEQDPTIGRDPVEQLFPLADEIFKQMMFMKEKLEKQDAEEKIDVENLTS